jgi:hypothetical protein
LSKLPPANHKRAFVSLLLVAPLLHVARILHTHDQANLAWHETLLADPPTDELFAFILRQHRANFELWHEEDAARSPGAPDARIAELKHAIDRLNQQRNDLVEQIDRLLLTFAGPQNQAAPLHSESPGLIIDRLSILALKRYHTAEEAHRASAPDAHRQRNQARLAILDQQRADLALCLEQLWTEVLAGQRRFRLYLQMKMYNDPELNPAIYSRAT